MKISNSVLLIIALIIALGSCTSNKQKLSDEIFKLETSDSSSSQSGMNDLAEKYFEYFTNFPKDSISEKYLYKAFMFKYLTSHWKDALDYSNQYKTAYGTTENLYNIYLKKADIYNKSIVNVDSACFYYLQCEDKIEFSAQEYRNAASTIEKWSFSARKIDSAIVAKSLFAAAKYYHLSTDFEQSAVLYTKISEQFPNYEKSPQSLSTAAFIYWNELKQIAKAKECYKILINNYPNSQSAKEASVIIKENMLEMNDEQLAEYLLKKSKTK